MSKASVKQVLIVSLLVMLLTPLLLIFRDGTVLASPGPEENYLWLSDGGDLIYQIPTSAPTTSVDSYDFGTSSPFGCEFVDGYIYFVDYGTDILYKKRWSDKSEDNSWDGYCGTAYGLAYGGGYFWVANRGSDEIYKVDPADPTNYLGTFDYSGIGYVSGLDWNSDNNRLLVSDDGSDTFYSFDISTVPDNGEGVTLEPDWTKLAPDGAPTALAWDGTYFWSTDDGTELLYKHYDNGDVVQSYDPPGTDPQGLAFGFYVEPPVLVSPGNGLITDRNNNTPTFVWENSIAAENHRIEVDNDADFSSPVDNVTVFENTWTKTGDGYDEGTYYWRVWAVGEYEMRSDDTWEFEVVMVVFYSTPSDGFLWKTSATYTTAWNVTTAADLVVGSYMMLGQDYSGGYYTIRRSFVFFDTSTIPDTATITSATLSLYGRSDRAGEEFDIVIQNGQPDYPSDPLVLGDYDRTYYLGNGGSINTENFITTGYNNIILNENVCENWIRKDNTTKLAIRSSREIAGTKPSDEEQVDIFANESGAGVKPILAINYTAPKPNVAPEVLDTYTPSTVDPNTAFDVKVEVRDNNNISDVEEVWLKAYENTKSQGDTDSARDHYTFKWVRAGADNWFEIGPDSTSPYDHLVVASCSAGDDAKTTDNFTFNIKLGVTASPVNKWSVWVKVVDNAGEQDNQEFANKFDVNEYMSLSIDDATLTFSGDPGETGKAASENPTECTVDANTDFNIQVKLSGDWSGSTYGGSIPMANTHADQNGSSPWDLNLTAAYQNIWSSVGWGEDVLKNIYWFLDFPLPLRDDVYSTTFYVNVVKA